MIETNVRQRGTIGGTDEQIRKRVDALKDYYGVKVGRPKSSSDGTNFDEDSVHNLKEICEHAGTTEGIYKKAQMLANAAPEVKEIIEQGRMSVSTARSFIAKLSDDEQRDLLAKLPATGKLTQAKVQQYVDQLKNKDAEIARQEDEIAALTAEKEESDRKKEEAERAAREALEAVKVKT